MNKIIFLAVISAFAFFACNDKAPQTAQTKDTIEQNAGLSKPDQESGLKENNRIVAGEQLGKTKIGLTGEELVKDLGAPDQSDAAMGKAWLVYKGKADPETELWIYTAYSDTSMRFKTVQFIRTTSAHFKTDEEKGVGSTNEELHRAYPQLTKVASRTEGKNNITLYDNGNGIAFEVSNDANAMSCIAVLVYEKGRNLFDIYRTKQPSLKAL